MSDVHQMTSLGYGFSDIEGGLENNGIFPQTHTFTFTGFFAWNSMKNKFL